MKKYSVPLNRQSAWDHFAWITPLLLVAAGLAMLGVWLQLRGLVLFALVIGGGTVLVGAPAIVALQRKLATRLRRKDMLYFVGAGGKMAMLRFSEPVLWNLVWKRRECFLGDETWRKRIAAGHGFTVCSIVPSKPDDPHRRDVPVYRVYKKPYRKGLYHYWHAHISAPRAAVGRERSQIDVYLGKDDALTVDRLRELAIAWRKQQEEWQEQISKAENSRKRRAIRKYLGMSHIAAIERYGIDALEDELKLDD